MGSHFPSIDGDTSDIRKYPEMTAKLLAWLPEDVRLVPGHAEDCDMAQARRFLDMLRKTGEIVRAEVAKGKDLARLQADDVLKDYASWESSYVKRHELAAVLVRGVHEPEPRQAQAVRTRDCRASGEGRRRCGGHLRRTAVHPFHLLPGWRTRR